MRAIDEAERRYQEARAALLKPDGTPVYTDHDEREAALWFDFRRDVSAITKAVDEAITEARATLAARAQADPTAGLTAEELTRADAGQLPLGRRAGGERPLLLFRRGVDRRAV